MFYLGNVLGRDSLRILTTFIGNAGGLNGVFESIK